jgi:4-hydroxybenzoate polyprenyltransferase
MFMSIVELLRPRQWIKNGLIAAPLFFSFEFSGRNIVLVLITIAGFCLLSSAIYAVNDIADRESDKHHPAKTSRPIASGRISVRTAFAVAAFLAAGAMFLLGLVGPSVLLTGLVYAAMNLAYSFGLKHVPILDVMLVSLGFVLRVIAGAYAIDVPKSHWILLCTFFLMLFVAFGKRMHEMNLLKEANATHRRSSAEYTEGFITQMLALTAGVSVVFYTFYTIDPQNVARFGTERLIYTTPFVVFGIFRYFYLLYNRNEGGDPVTAFLKDRQLLLCGLLWLFSVTFVYLHGKL